MSKYDDKQIDATHRIQPAHHSHITHKYLDVPYAHESASQKLDIYFPENIDGPYPLIINIHGGGFAIGDKSDAKVEPYFKALERGYAVASINYRLSGEAIFPAAIYDCKCAVRFLRAKADEYKLNSTRFAAVGGSAGGNLAAMLATSEGIEELEDLSLGYEAYTSGVQACVDWFGPTDFLKMDEQLNDLNLGPCNHNNSDSPESKYLGKQLTLLDPVYVDKANPMTYISNNMPPIYIQHGDSDHMVPMLQSRIFANEITDRLGGDRVIFEVIIGADHGDIMFEAFENMRKVLNFLDRHMKDNI